MTIELNRRLFLIGTGAAIAGAAIPQGVLPDQIIAIPPAPRDPGIEVIRRELYDMMFSAIDVPKGHPDSDMEFAVRRSGAEHALYRQAITVRNSLRWVAPPTHEFVFLQDQVLEIDWTGVPPGGARSGFYIKEIRKDGFYRHIFELREINDDGSIAKRETLPTDPRGWIDPNEVIADNRSWWQRMKERWGWGSEDEDVWDDV